MSSITPRDSISEEIFVFNKLVPSLFVLLVALSMPSLLFGQANSESTIPFPRDPAQWVNSPPITMDILKGKAAFLWFFEEQCPRCRAKWPELIKIAESFKGEPIVFIGVNSGNSRGEVEAYLRDVNCRWPTVVDTSREFEKACDVTEISLQNIFQVRVIRADGRMSQGDWSAIEDSAKRALTGAKWNVDPKTMPTSLISTWQNVEFGNYSAAATAIKQNIKSTKADIKEAATKLNDYVQAEMQKELAVANTTAAAGGWKAYKAYKDIGDRYAGYDLPADVAEKLKTLAAQPEIKAENERFKQLDVMKKGLQASSATARKGVVLRLKKFAQDFADTAAGREAQELLKASGN